MNTEASGWYAENDWQDCELARLLNSVVELGITAENDSINIPSTNELLKSLYNDGDDSKLSVIYSSEIFANTISVKITSQEGIMVRNEAYKNTDGILKEVEVFSLVKFINKSGISIEDGISVGKVFESLSDVTVRQTIVESNILNITVVSKFDEADGLEIPKKYLDGDKVNTEASGWYAENDWEDCELARLLNSVVELGITADENDNIVMPETDSLLKSLNDKNDEGKVKLDVVYLSEIIAKTISVKITSQKGIFIRAEAYQLDEKDNLTDILWSNEILLLVNFVETAGISLGDEGNNLNAESIFGIIKDNEKGKEARRTIVESNILNITVVSKFDEAEGLEIPEKYLDGDKVNTKASGWYPSSEDWEDCELAHLLNTVVELDVKVVNGVPQFENNVTSLLGCLSEDSVTSEEDLTKLNVVYLSDVIKQTIKVKLEGLKDSGVILVRDKAYEGNYFAEDEIKYLVDFVNGSNLELDNLNAEQLFDVLADETNGETLRQTIVLSNILNITTVDKIAGDGNDSAIKFTNAYLKSDGSVNRNSSAWYPVGDDYQNCELYRLLICVDELEITATGNTISISINDKLDMLLDTNTKHGLAGQTKLDVAYLSDSIAMTLSTRLNEFTNVPYYSYSGELMYDQSGNRFLTDNILVVEEVEALLKGLTSLGMTFASGIESSDVENVSLTKLADNIDVVLSSSILHYIISDKLINQTQSGASVVVYNYWSGNESYADIEVVKKIGEGNYGTDNTYIYVHTSQIKEAIEVLDMMGINSLDDISDMNDISSISQYFTAAASKGYTSDELIKNITESAITSKIFSELFLSLPSYALYGITQHDVVEVYDNDVVKAICAKELKILLASQIS